MFDALSTLALLRLDDDAAAAAGLLAGFACVYIVVVLVITAFFIFMLVADILESRLQRRHGAHCADSRSWAAHLHLHPGLRQLAGVAEPGVRKKHHTEGSGEKVEDSRGIKIGIFFRFFFLRCPPRLRYPPRDRLSGPSFLTDA